MNRSTTTPRAVAIWIRVSTEDQAQGESPHTHEMRARMYAELKGWQVVRVYDLSGVSGKTVWNHPEAQAMRDDIEVGRIQALIFSKLARLARNTKELLEFADFFQQQGADLISLQESIDTSTPAGRLFYTLIAAMAQWEREEISERIKASVVTRAKLGKSLGGAAPYGYRWDNKTLVIDEDEAPVRALMYDLYLELRRFKTVANRLNDMGHRTRRGAKFSHTTVRRLLEDPTAKGERRANYTQSLGEGKRWELKPESEWEITEVPAIISSEKYEQVRTVLTANTKKRPASKQVKYLFSGLVQCQCGTKMYPINTSGKYYCRGCRNKIAPDALEQIFVSQLKGFFLDAEAIERQLEAGQSRVAEKRELLSTLTTERNRVQRSMDQVFQLYLDGDLSGSLFAERNGPLEERRDALDQELPRLQGEIDALSIDQASVETVVADSLTLYGAWDQLGFEEKRTVVETIVDQITLGDDTVDIALAYVAPSDGVEINSPALVN